MKTSLSLHLLCALTLLNACKKDDTPVTPPATEPALTLQGTAYSAETRVSVYAADSLRQGYNSLYLQFTDSVSGSILQTMNATITPMMYMTSHTHSCPVEQPSSVTAASNYFPCAAVFMMASNSMEPWTIKVSFNDTIRHKTGNVEIPITVAGTNLVTSFIGPFPDSIKYFVTMRRIEGAKVGMNDCEFLVHKRQSMMSFPAVTDLNLEMTPDMPSMGHGSPGNVNPTHTCSGHYCGKVNFTMTGEWRITLVVKRDTTTQGTAVFWMTL